MEDWSHIPVHFILAFEYGNLIECLSDLSIKGNVMDASIFRYCSRTLKHLGTEM